MVAAVLLVAGSIFLIRRNIISGGSPVAETGSSIPEDTAGEKLTAETEQTETKTFSEQADQSEDPGVTASESESRAAESTEDTQQAEQTEAESGTPDRFGYVGLYDTGICYIRGTEPAFAEGISLRETMLYPAPCESIYEFGKIYPGRSMEIIRAVTVGTYDEHDSLTDSDWYLVSTGTTDEIGYVKKEDVANAAETFVEATEPWQLKAGAVYYTDRSCSAPHTAETVIGPLWGSVNPDMENQVWKLEGVSGIVVYIKDLDALEMFRNTWQPRNGRAG